MTTELPDPTCGDCKAFFRPATTIDGEVRGSCMRRSELQDIPREMKYCYLFQVKDSAIGRVKAVETKAPASRRTRSRATTSTNPYADIATMEHPTVGDTEGDISMDRDGLKQVLRELLEEETMYGYPTMGKKWEGGTLVMKPASDENQPKELDLETFFHKIVMVRDRLRVLEAKLNGNKTLPEAEKVELQSYISKAYGSLTSFNVLFQDKSNHFSSK